MFQLHQVLKVLQQNKVLKVLQQNRLYINLKKCLFFCKEFVFLSFIIAVKGVKPYSKKVQGIIKGPIPTTLRVVQRFNELSSLIKIHKKFQLYYKPY